MSTEAELLEEHMRGKGPRTLKLAASRIVTLDDHGIDTFVCFKFKKASRDEAFRLHPLGENIKIELSDTNGEFVNAREYYLLEVEVPNEGNPLGGQADVLIIKAERQ